jgi:D-3-phosphoglycerate dehydrogenase
MGLEVKIHTVDLEDVLSDADAISLHTPSTEKPILGREEFSKMKDGVILVNCSRGGTVDEEAMLEALNSGKILAAGLDVFDHEPTPREDVLVHPRVSLTPHIGASTTEAQNKIGSELASSLIEALSS